MRPPTQWTQGIQGVFYMHVFFLRTPRTEIRLQYFMIMEHGVVNITKLYLHNSGFNFALSFTNNEPHLTHTLSSWASHPSRDSPGLIYLNIKNWILFRRGVQPASPLSF